MAGQGQQMQGAPDAMTVAIRPLSKGMFRDRPSQMIEAGGARSLEGFAVERMGLKGLSGFKPWTDGATEHYGQIPFDFDSERVQGFFVFYTSAGAQQALALTQFALYRSTDLISYSRVPYGRLYTKVSLTGATLVFDGSYADEYHDALHLGMTVKLQNTSTSLWETFAIGSVTNATTIVLSTTPPNAYNNDFYIYETFQAAPPYIVQATPAPSALYMVDGTGYGIRKYAGAFMSRAPIHDENGDNTEASPHPAPFTGATSICYAGGRLVVGCVNKSGVDGRKMLYWSSATDLNEFATTSYKVFANSAGEVIALRTLENYPVVFLATGVAAGTDYGLDSSDVDPWLFKMLESGGKHPVSPRGITSVPNALAFIAKTDICLISSLKRTSQGEFQIDSLDCPVLSETVDIDENKSQAVAFYDVKQDAIGFCFFASAGAFTDIWYYFQRTKAWAHRGFMPFAFTAIGDVSMASVTTWAIYGAAGVTWDTAPARAWQSYLVDYSVSHVAACDANGIVYITDDSRGYDTYVNALDWTTQDYGIRHVFETGDMDFDAPDDQKCIHNFAARVSGNGVRATDITMRLQVSIDKGRSWHVDRQLTLSAGEDEEELHFRTSGTNLRFRLSYTTLEAPFVLEELTMRVRLCGAQTVRGVD